MGLLETIASPSDLRSLTPDQLTELAEEIRGFLISAVTRTGGHLGPNLGVVELTLALHQYHGYRNAFPPSRTQATLGATWVVYAVATVLRAASKRRSTSREGAKLP